MPPGPHAAGAATGLRGVASATRSQTRKLSNKFQLNVLTYSCRIMCELRKRFSFHTHGICELRVWEIWRAHALSMSDGRFSRTHPPTETRCPRAKAFEVFNHECKHRSYLEAATPHTHTVKATGSPRHPTKPPREKKVTHRQPPARIEDHGKSRQRTQTQRTENSLPRAYTRNCRLCSSLEVFKERDRCPLETLIRARRGPAGSHHSHKRGFS